MKLINVKLPEIIKSRAKLYTISSWVSIGAQLQTNPISAIRIDIKNTMMDDYEHFNSY